MSNDAQQPLSPRSKAPLTDSPWFWLFLFGPAGLAALAAIGPKYMRRQAKIEQQYYANREILRRQAQTPQERGQASADAKEPPARGELLVPLRPIVVTLAALLLAAAVLLALARSHRKHPSQQARAPHESA